MKKFLISIFCIFSFEQSIAAEFLNGNKLFEYTNSPANSHTYGFFSGYVSGISDAQDGIYFCIPEGVTIQQVGDITKKYLNENPEVRHMSASGLVITVLREKFPCKKQ